MRKAEVHETPTLFALVHRAAEVCDPSGVEDGAAELLRRFEDRDEPVGDPAEAATYLAYRRDEIDDDRENLLVLAARAALRGDAFGTTPRGEDGNPPEPV